MELIVKTTAGMVEGTEAAHGTYVDFGGPTDLVSDPDGDERLLWNGIGSPS